MAYIKQLRDATSENKIYPITHVNAVFDDNSKNVVQLINETGRHLTEVTYAELVALRDNSQLKAGMCYRITDYVTTTNTPYHGEYRSAGHQFDVVVMALGANVLAEEGWAMMHDNIYDVTFSDGVTKKCWLYNYTADYYTIVDIETNLGLTNLTVGRGDIIVNNATKTATTPAPSNAMTNPNLPYNYFQNSNLSAWKVWYCLDNDTARFAWADDSVDEGSPASITSSSNPYNIFYRDFSKDRTITFPTRYSIRGWTDDNDSTIYTGSATPNVGDNVLTVTGATSTADSVASYTPAQEGTGLPNGRGVIYRMIDEFGNDVPYDFKNIQKLKYVDATGNGADDTYCYLFSHINVVNSSVTGEVEDSSLKDYGIAGKSGVCITPFNNVFSKTVRGYNGSTLDGKARVIDGIIFFTAFQYKDGIIADCALCIDNIINSDVTQSSVSTYGEFDTRSNIYSRSNVGKLVGYTVGSLE